MFWLHNLVHFHAWTRNSRALYSRFSSASPRMLHQQFSTNWLQGPCILNIVLLSAIVSLPVYTCKHTVVKLLSKYHFRIEHGNIQALIRTCICRPTEIFELNQHRCQAAAWPVNHVAFLELLARCLASQLMIFVYVVSVGWRGGGAVIATTAAVIYTMAISHSHSEGQTDQTLLKTLHPLHTILFTTQNDRVEDRGGSFQPRRLDPQETARPVGSKRSHQTLWLASVREKYHWQSEPTHS